MKNVFVAYFIFMMLIASFTMIIGWNSAIKSTCSNIVYYKFEVLLPVRPIACQEVKIVAWLGEPL